MLDRMPLAVVSQYQPAATVLPPSATRLFSRLRQYCTWDRKTVRMPLTILALVGLTIVMTPDPLWAQNSVWQTFNNINSNAQDTLLKAMITVGIVMIIVGAWMWKQEKGGALPVLLLGLALIVVGGLTASTVLSGIGANGGPSGQGF